MGWTARELQESRESCDVSTMMLLNGIEILLKYKEI